MSFACAATPKSASVHPVQPQTPPMALHSGASIAAPKHGAPSSASVPASPVIIPAAHHLNHLLDHIHFSPEPPVTALPPAKKPKIGDGSSDDPGPSNFQKLLEAIPQPPPLLQQHFHLGSWQTIYF